MVPEIAADQSHLWAKLEDGTVYATAKVSTDASRNWFDARRRWESADLRSMDTEVAIVWDTDARKRAESRGKVVYDHDDQKIITIPRCRKFATPERRSPGPSRIITE
tara:strand:+ start:958 stop:1278 length:321 start_codon:yes stop_codon:yes gene_type:complete